MKKVMVLLSMIIALVACGQASGNSNNPVSGKYGDTEFIATVTNNQIEIRYHDGIGDALYWKGSFSAGSTVTSVGDRKAMDTSILASQSKTKVFTIKHGNIFFDYSALGVTRLIQLEKV